MITRMAFGGTLNSQLAIGVLVLATTLSVLLAWINIKRLQIDQHRKWMLRAWFYVSFISIFELTFPTNLRHLEFGSIISERLIQRIVFQIISSSDSYYYAMSCKRISGVMMSFGIPAELVATMYPSCQAFFNGTNPTEYVAVQASINGRPEQVTAVLDITFGMSIWFAFLIHAIGIEIYVSRLLSVSICKSKEVFLTGI
jgi:hypothetical protein